MSGPFFFEPTVDLIRSTVDPLSGDRTGRFGTSLGKEIIRQDDTNEMEQEKSQAGHGISVRFTFIIVGVALLIRFLYWGEIHDDELYQTPLLDAAFYDQWAQDLAGITPFDQPVHHQAPLFPYLLSLLYRLFGQSINAIVFFNFGVGALTAVLVAHIAATAFLPKVGRVAGVLAALYVPLFFNEATVMPTSLNVLFHVVILLRAQKLFASPGFKNALWLGIAGGVGYICRAEVVLFLFFLALGFLFHLRKNPRQVLSIAGAATLGILPFLFLFGMYSYSHTEKFRVLPSSDGMNFYLGNNEEAKGTGEPPSTLSRNREEIVVSAERLAEEHANRELTPEEVSTELRNMALDFITENPGEYLHLLLTKAWLFIHGKESCDILHYGFMDQSSYVKRFSSFLFDFKVFGPLAVLGLLLAFNYIKRGAATLYLLILSNLALVLLFAVSTRYRLPSAPAFLCFTAFTLVAIQQCFKNRKAWLRGVSIVFSTCLLAALVNAKSEALMVNHAQVWINVSTIRSRAGNHQEAIEALEKALEADPGAWKAWQLLGENHAELNQFDPAAKAYQASLQRNPENEIAWINLGVLLLEQGRNDEAIATYKAAVQQLPESADSYLYLALVHSELEHWNDALVPARKAMELAPNQVETNNQLAWILLHLPDRTAGQLDEAVRIATKAVRLSNRADEGTLDTLAQALEAAGKSKEAAIIRDEIRNLTRD